MDNGKKVSIWMKGEGIERGFGMDKGKGDGGSLWIKAKGFRMDNGKGGSEWMKGEGTERGFRMDKGREDGEGVPYG